MSKNKRKQPVWMIPIGIGLVISVGIFIYTFIAEEPSSAAKSSIPQSVISSSPHSYSEPVAKTTTVKMNGDVPQFGGTDTQGQPFKLTDWDGKFKLLFFADLSCPCVQAYNNRMKAIHEKYSPQGVEVAYVFSDANDTLRKIRELVETEKYPWRNVVDADQKIMSLFNVQCTTEVFLIDKENKLRYHGRVDDSIFEPNKAKEHDLENAINALLEDKPVPVEETQAYACTIPKIKPKSEAASSAKPKIS